jgi:hypothetical protein
MPPRSLNVVHSVQFYNSSLSVYFVYIGCHVIWFFHWKILRILLFVRNDNAVSNYRIWSFHGGENVDCYLLGSESRAVL